MVDCEMPKKKHLTHEVASTFVTTLHFLASTTDRERNDLKKD